MIAEIDRMDLTRRGRIDLRFEHARSTFDVAKRSERGAASVENRRRVSLALQGFLPRGEQGVVRFHPLREGLSVPKFATRFQT